MKFKIGSNGLLKLATRQPLWAKLTALALVMLTLLALWPMATQAQIAPDAVGPVFALRGSLSRATNEPFDTFLTTADGSQYGLVGNTPEVEGQIVTLRDSGPNTIAKVWGDRYSALAEGDFDTIVVGSIQPDSGSVPTQQATSQPTAQPTAQPTTAPATAPTAVPTSAVPLAVVEAPVVNVRNGPGTEYAPVGSLVAGQSCQIIGRNQANSWLQLSCAGGLTGWVRADLLATTGAVSSVSVVQVAAPPTPTVSAPTNFSGWRADFYANRDLQGDPALVRDVPAVNFNWGTASPGTGIPVNNFSARFQRTLNFGYGNYDIRVTVDDGARVYVDDQLVIDSWETGASRTLWVRRFLSGNHRFRVEFFEAGGNAQIQLSVDLISATNEWTANYYNNRSLSGPPILVRSEPRGGQFPLDFNWGFGSPAAGVVQNDNFSARWTGNFNFQSGDYRFTMNVDDGARVYIDGIRILDVWEDGYHNGVSNIFRNLGAGNHTITVEYYDASSGGYTRVWWERLDGGGDGSGGNNDDRDRDD